MTWKLALYALVIFLLAATAKSLQSCPTLCNPMDRSPPGSPIHEILQARILEGFTISFSMRLIIGHLYYGLPRWLGGKESACQAGHMGSVPGSKNHLEKELATHSSVFAWEILWTEEPGGLQSKGCKELDMTKHTCTMFYMYGPTLEN